MYLTKIATTSYFMCKKFIQFTNNNLLIHYFTGNNPYSNLLRKITVAGRECQYYDLSTFGEQYGKFTIPNYFYNFNNFYISNVYRQATILHQSALGECYSQLRQFSSENGGCGENLELGETPAPGQCRSRF